MSEFIEPIRPMDVLASEAPGTLSREQLTIVSGAGKLDAGTVLGKVTASGKYKTYDDGASDGTQAAAAILLYPVDATSADVKVACVVRLAEVKSAALGWGSNNGTGKTNGLADLAALFIVAR